MEFSEKEIEKLSTLISINIDKIAQSTPSRKVKIMEDNLLLSVREAADLLHVTPTTIHIWKAQGRISFKKIGRRTLFDKSELIRSLVNVQMPKRI